METKEIDTEDLATEIYNNVKEDRQRIKDICSQLGAISVDDPLATAGHAEIVARLQDCLTKSNLQLIELLKVRKPRKNDDKDSDRETLYDDIQGKKHDRDLVF